MSCQFHNLNAYEIGFLLHVWGEVGMGWLSNLGLSLRKLKRNFRSTDSYSIGCAKGGKVPSRAGGCKRCVKSIPIVVVPQACFGQGPGIKSRPGAGQGLQNVVPVEVPWAFGVKVSFPSRRGASLR